MNKSASLFFQGIIVLFGAGILIFMLMEPHFEGRNAHSTVFEVYFNDPFLAYAYVGSLPFFFALYRAFGLFGHAGRTGAFSQVTVNALRSIKRCALTLIGFVAGAAVFILFMGDKEDRPAGFFMCLLVIVATSVVATAATFLARNLQNALKQSGAQRV